MGEFSNNTGAPIATDHAWRLLDGWKVDRKELGIWVAAPRASVSGEATVAAVRTWGMRLNMRDAEFTYDPMTTGPRWPSPPMVDASGWPRLGGSGGRMKADKPAAGGVTCPTESCAILWVLV